RAGVGVRAAARQLLGAIPIAGWVVKGGVAYGGTRALGEAAHRYFHAVTKERAAACPPPSGPGPMVPETTGGRRDGRFRARGRAASDRGSGRLVRVPRGHAGAE